MAVRPSPAWRGSKASRGRGKPAGGGITRWGNGKKLLLCAGLVAFLTAVGTTVYFYVRFSRVIDARLSGDVFNNASLVFAAPKPVFVGEAIKPEEVAARLRKGLYSESEGGSEVGTYRRVGNRLEIHPGEASFFQSDLFKEGPAALEFANGHIVSITSLSTTASLETYKLEPEVITTLFDSSRSKRRLVRYQDLPKTVIDAVVATEDHSFFSHHGVNLYRIVASGLHDMVRPDEIPQGGSTLTMTLARNIFGLTPQRKFGRKIDQVFLALLLEQRLNKEQIFELFANQIYLGQRGGFSIYGFGEGASAYFNEDVGSLTADQAALLAGMIRGPNIYSPYKYPARALERRNFVLRSMKEQGMLTPQEMERASEAPLGVVTRNVEATQAPYFVDMVKDQLLSQFSDHDLLSQSYRVYTTLDLDVQEAASAAVNAGSEEVDKRLKKYKIAKDAPPPDPLQPQMALVVLDPHTGWLKALVGGRDYGRSQLNHVLAKRQPGSSFKPFVYAAALTSGVDGSQPLITTVTELNDEPTTFQFGDQAYEPENFKQEYFGKVTLRQALMHSLNVATVRLAEMTGYEKVRTLAVAAGFNTGLIATPAIALGAYVATPLEVAGAYTIFSNGGTYVEPRFILEVNDASGRLLWRSQDVTRQVLDPRVSYLMVNLLESVINNGTGAGARSRGFTLPAAGKTGTSHDGWFAGFTSNLLAVAWVGYDDDRELNLQGADSALPIWTEFMKRATQDPSYRDAQPFEAPPGVVAVPVETASTLASGDEAVTVRNEYFIEGTEPQGGEPSKGGGGILSRLFHSGNATPVPVAAAAPPANENPAPASPNADGSSRPDEKKGGVLRKFLSIFKGKNSKTPSPQDAPKTTPPEG
ncbi:MAG TPA: PBP1A family penicillin-binding protein [Terriglobia bacterium]|nr:PBP1A family penicillin-binding protein [Terriglobia bacterium]